MKILISVAAAMTALAGGPALAQTRADAATATIRYADLDLASAAGRRALDRRIGFAVRDACGTASTFDLHGANAVRACVTGAKKAVAAQRSAALASARRPSGDRFAAGR
jgi:UrcA family protein